jgi:hypothetical protein
VPQGLFVQEVDCAAGHVYSRLIASGTVFTGG